MKDHVEIGYLTKYDASRINRDQVIDLEIRFKIIIILRQRPPKSHKLLILFMISVILFKISKHSDFHLIFSQKEGA